MADRIDSIKVGFYDPFEVFPLIEESATSKVQLTNLHWKRSANDNLRSIPKLPFKFLEETPKFFDNNELGPKRKISNTEHPLNTILDVLKGPHSRIVFFRADSLETYRSQVRPLITAWKDENITKAVSDIDWLIVYYVDSSETKSHQKVYEKVKTDFGDTADTTERFLKLKKSYATPLEESEAWNTFTSLLRRSVLHTFNDKLHVLNEASNSKIIMDSAVASTALKEGIARQFLQFYLLEDALSEYYELEKKINDRASKFKPHKGSLKGLESFIDQHQLMTDPTQDITLFSLKSYIFGKQFTILEALSESTTSISIASLHVSELLKKFQIFIRDISSLFDKTIVVYEWVYKTINDVLASKTCSKIIESEHSDETINQISERIGELLLLQRSKYLSIASSFGLDIKSVYTDLLLDEHKVLEYTDLKSSLSSREAFEEKFVTLTANAIKHFTIGSRPRTVDSLSIDIALLDHHNKNYAKAALVLANCPAFYDSEGWDFIGFHLLEIYIDCLENIEEDLLDQPKNLLLASNYALLLSSKKLKQFVPEEKLRVTLQKLLSIKLTEEVKFPLSKIFDIELIPYVTPKRATYQIVLSLGHNLPFSLDLGAIQVTLIGDDNQTIKFKSDCTQAGQTSSHYLETRDIIFGNFRALNCSIKIGPLELLYDFEENIGLTVYPSSSTTLLSIGTPTKKNLNSKTVSIFVDAKEILESAEFLITSLDGIDIHRDELTISDNIQKDYITRNDGILEVARLESDQVYEIIIPYTPNPKLNSFSLLAELKYRSDGVDYSQAIKSIIDNKLSIAVSVQDIYKNNGLYSNFTIGTADVNTPVRILSVELVENEKFKVTTGLKSNEVIAFGEQPASYFFKIEPERSGFSSNSDSLLLDIEFRDLDEELLLVWNNVVREKFKANDISNYAGLFSNLKDLAFNYQSYISDSVLELIQLETFNWKLLKAVRPQDKERVKEALVDLIGSKTAITNLDFTNRHLFIDVLIPLPKVIHTVELEMPKGLAYMALGEEIHTKLIVKSIVNVEESTPSSKSKKKVLFKTEESNVYELEVYNMRDNWLVNGKTKFSFELEGDISGVSERESTLTLIPLKIGKLMLPKIKITNPTLQSKDQNLMEVDYKNDNETIIIVSEKK